MSTPASVPFVSQGSGRLRGAVFAGSLVSLVLVSYLDYISGYQLLFYVFYFLPVCLCAWFLRGSTTFGMAALSGAAWGIVDKFSGQPYPHVAFRYWNSLMCFVAFAIIGLVLHRLRRALAEQQRAQKELVKALEELKHSTEEIRKLQSGLQVVCAWTKRIRVNGQWIAIDKFLADNLHLSITHGISPEALEEVRKALDDEKPE
jgi:hypothetical protein